MDITKKVKKIASFIGYSSTRPSGHQNVQINITILINLTLNLALTTSCVTYLFHNWNDFDKRFTSMKSLSTYCSFDLYIIIYICKWGKIQSMLDLLENRDIDVFPFDNQIVTRQRKEMISIGMKGQEDQNRYIHYTCMIYFNSVSVIPFVCSMIKLYNNSGQTRVDYLQFSQPFYVPNVFNEHIYVYFLIAFLQTSYNLFCWGYAYVTHVTGFSAMSMLVNDIRLLRLTLKEMDEIIFTNNDAYQTNIRNYLKFVAHHQQLIYRKKVVIKEGIETIVFVYHSAVSIYACMAVYFTVQSSELMFKIIEFILLALTVSIIYLYDMVGEKLITEGENLRIALYDSQWMTKPVWFKKSLLLCMTRSTTPIQIKPWGLLILSLNSFAMMINATYSYYNLLNSANKS